MESATCWIGEGERSPSDSLGDFRGLLLSVVEVSVRYLMRGA